MHTGAWELDAREREAEERMSGGTMKEFQERGQSGAAPSGQNQAGFQGEADVQLSNQEKQQYGEYVKQVTPAHSLGMQMIKAFVTGGAICCIGQGILNYAGSLGLDKDTAGAWCSLLLVLLSVVLTGLNIFPGIAKWGGAGALVPITGFANSVAAPAIEYQKEGQVFGIGCKIFTIAGPVILYGIFTSWLLGLIYWVLKLTGVV